jgi:glyoxylase-like metal-dependent hydrolase (beta-lactamase superfamily II)
VKIYPDLIFISDTGCNSPRQKNKTVISLRQYLETIPVPANNDSPLNPKGAKPYLILCTHCHYDHILGIPLFLSSPDDNPTILASSHSKSFIQDDLPTHSLCKYLHIPTPSYRISHWARHLEYLSWTDPSATLLPGEPTQPLRIQLLHIPGHTPDSLAWYDIDSHHLYIGDMFYARRRDPDFPILTSSSSRDHAPIPAEGLPAFDDAPIIFPFEGNLIDYLSSLSLLLSFIQHQNFLLQLRWGAEPIDRPPPENRSPPRVLLGSGHVTASSDAESMTLEVRELFWGIITGSVKIRRSEKMRGEWCDYWVEPDKVGRGDGEGGRYSVLAPRRLVEEARRHFGEKGMCGKVW